jgi:AcrR family transcriptional regulator
MARPHSKRDEMVASALHLFADHGIRGTTIRDIAQAAGVTEGALYRHFASKEQLAQSLFGECARMLYEHLDAAVADVAAPRDQLCALAHGFIGFATTRPEAYEFVMARHHESVGELPPGQPLPKDVFVRVIAGGIASGDFRPMHAQLGAGMMIGLLLRTVFFVQRGLVDLTAEQIEAEVCGAVERIFLTA